MPFHADARCSFSASKDRHVNKNDESVFLFLITLRLLTLKKSVERQLEKISLDKRIDFDTVKSSKRELFFKYRKSCSVLFAFLLQ